MDGGRGRGKGGIMISLVANPRLTRRPIESSKEAASDREMATKCPAWWGLPAAQRPRCRQGDGHKDIDTSMDRRLAAV